MTRLLLAATAIPALLTAPALAQSVFELDEIVFASNLTETAADRSGASATIVTAADLEAAGDIRVLDYLRRVPGISIRANGPLGSQAGLTIRGVSQQNIVVRVDGIDVSDPSGPQVAFDFGGLTTADISRIEIIRGSQSALYGSQAIGGVIDITTRRATADGLSQAVAAEYGSYNTFSGAYSLSNRGVGHESTLTLSTVTSDGYSAAEEGNGNTEADGFQSARISFSGRYDIGDQLQLEASAFVEEQTFDVDETLSCPATSPIVCDGTPDDVTERDQTGARVALSFDAGSFEHVLEASAFRITRQLTGTNAFGGYDLTYTGDRLQYGYRAIGDLGSSGQIVLGLERVEEGYTDLLDFGFGAGGQSFDTTVNSAFAEYTFAPTDQIDVATTLRYDDHSQFGDFVTGRLSVAYRPTEDLILRGNFATGYRAPSNYELYDAFAGNAALQPETSLSFDLGVERRFGDNGYVAATVFWIEAEDIIDYSFTTFGYVQRPGTSTRRGVELSGGHAYANGMSIDAAYTFTDSYADVVLDSSGWTTAVPRHALSATFGAALRPGVDLSLTGNYQADRVGLDDFVTFDATVAYAFTPDVEMYLRLENLLDEEYQTIPGYGASDRAVYVGLRATF